MKLVFVACCLAMLGAIEKGGNIRVLPVARTPESTTVSLRIAVPQSDQVVSTPVWMQFRIDGYPLGAGSNQFERASEIATSKMGQTVHVIIDNKPYFAVNEPAIDPFTESTYFYNMSYKFKVPFALSSGPHTVRMFPARSYGESLKGDGTYVAMNFYVGSGAGEGPDLSLPYITYNEPSNQMYWTEGSPVLLDFYITNTELSPDGYKVRLTIDGKVQRIISSWQPYYLYGLKKGSHKIELDLIDETGHTVEGPFSSASQQIAVH